MKTVPTLEEFNKVLAERNLTGQWQADELLQRAKDGPKPIGSAFLWKWQLIYGSLLEACDVLTEQSTQRRNISFLNPGLLKSGRFGTSHTIVAGMQMVMPGEAAYAHRHSIGAVRFGIEGKTQLYTVVDGEAMPLLPNDLVLTPNWNWHDHHNDSDQVGIWLDVLDVPLVAGGLNQTFYEELGEHSQPQRDQRGDYVSERAKLVRPAWERRAVRNFPFRYPWSEVEPLLRNYAQVAGSPYDGTLLEYVNPMTGGSTLPTLSCAIQRLAPGFETKPHRHTSSAVYFVVGGEGETVVDGAALEWSTRDSFVVPNWARHHHRNRSRTEEALLFTVTDQPVLEALGLYREDPEDSRHAPLPVVPANRNRR
jgi:1-hydroxy-2-naphthoate dioxygenase